MASIEVYFADLRRSQKSLEKRVEQHWVHPRDISCHRGRGVLMPLQSQPQLPARIGLRSLVRMDVRPLCLLVRRVQPLCYSQDKGTHGAFIRTSDRVQDSGIVRLVGAKQQPSDKGGVM